MKMTVLVAEDDTHTRLGIVEVLKQEGFLVIQAADGNAAWDQFQCHAVDFVCLDVMMPELNGYEVCRRIRSRNATMPVIFLTAKGEEVDKVVGLEIGADDYIVKPFGVKELVARIRAVARRSIASANHEPHLADSQREFEMGDLVVIPSQLRAKRGDTSIDLSLRDIKILVLLHQRAGQVVDRRAIMNAAWDQEYLPNSRTLDQHISQLRKRIEVDSKVPRIIQTVHSVGYRFEDC
jgi:DNA-binding response OmpR family regulator